MERSIRSTRGKRFTELVGEEADKDKAFWEHSTWNEDEDDSGNESYEENEEELKPDVFDSDFNDSEDDESEEDEEENLRKSNKRKAPKTKNTYKEPKIIKRKITTSTSTSTSVSRIGKLREGEEEEKEEGEGRGEGEYDVNKVVNKGPKISKTSKIVNDSENILSVKLRKSTTTKTLQHEQARLEANQRIRIIQRPPLPKPEFTQRQLLIEALDTELKNEKWLRGQKLVEDEKNYADKPMKAPIVEKLTSLSRRGTFNTITFPDSKWPEIFEPSSRTVPNKTCVVTGLTARYIDPITGFPYHNLEAYKIIKAQHHHPK